MKQSRGFTLLEILIALSIFSILAVITSTAMFHAFNTRAKMNLQADLLHNVQLSMSLLQHDMRQMTNRAVRGNDMRLYSALIGQPRYLELTREGIANPESLEKRSTLKRIALICENGTLKRRTWTSLDTPNRNNWEENILLENISSCKFSYIDHSLHVLNEWQEVAPEHSKGGESLPKAVQLNITLNPWGNANLIFIVPEALYAKI